MKDILNYLIVPLRVKEMIKENKTNTLLIKDYIPHILHEIVKIIIIGIF